MKPQDYAVVNDNYSKDHHMTKRNLEHVINIRFLENKLEFYGIGNENLKKRRKFLSKWKGCGTSLFHIRTVGQWPFGEDRFDPFYDSGGCCW